MSSQQISTLVSFIWGIAYDCLRDVYVRGKCRDVILPMTVVRRLDAVLEPTKKAVLELKARLDATGVSNQAAALKVPLRKNLGQKNCEFSPGNRAEILRLFLAFEDGPRSVCPFA